MGSFFTFSEHTRDIVVDIDDTSVLGLIQSNGSHLHLGEVDTAQSNALVDVSHQGVGNYTARSVSIHGIQQCLVMFRLTLNTNGTLGLFGASANVRSKNEVAQAH